MSIKKVIEIDVVTGDANAELEKLEGSFKEVDKAAEQTNKSVDDVAGNGGAIAILDQLTGGLATRFRDAFEASKLFNLSLKAQRTALIATGIGAFVVALGLIVAYWSEIDDWVSGVNRKLERQLEAYERITDQIDHQLRLLKLDKDLAVLRGEATDDLIQKEKDLLAVKKKNLEDTLANLVLQLEIEQSKIREITLFEKGLIGLKAYVLGYQTVAQSAADALGFTTISEIQGKINDLTEQLKQNLIDIETINSGGKTDAEGRTARVKQTGANALTPQDQLTFDSRKALNELLAIEDKDALAIKLANERQAALAEQQLAEQVKDAKVGIAFNTLGLLRMVAEEGSAFGKSLAVAQTTLSGIEGVQNAFTTASKSPITTVFPAYPFIQAGLAGAFSLAQIQQILKVDPMGGGNVSPIGGQGGRAPSAPNFNIVQGSEGSQILNAINSQDKVTKAFVVSSDMTSSQSLDRNIIESSSL